LVRAEWRDAVSDQASAALMGEHIAKRLQAGIAERA
jgi:hypothetical protein